MARPVITTDAPGCRETVIDGVNGFLVPPRDVDALVRAMERFIQQPELILTMGQASRKLAEERFDVHKINQRILEVMGISPKMRKCDRASVCVMPYVQATQSSVPWIAAAFGVPVVATATGGLAAQVQQMNGVLVPPNDPKALAEGMLTAVGSSAVFPEAWNPSLIAGQYLQMYREILCRKGASL